MYSIQLLYGANIAACIGEFSQFFIAPIPLVGASIAPSTGMFRQNDEVLYAEKDRKLRGFLEKSLELDINVVDAVNWSSEW